MYVSAGTTGTLVILDIASRLAFRTIAKSKTAKTNEGTTWHSAVAGRLQLYYFGSAEGKMP